MVTTGDPVGDGIVPSLARPGGNVTGVTALGQTLNTKRLELLKEAVPGIARVAVLINPASTYTPQFLRERDAAARALKLDILTVEAKDPREFENSFSAMIAGRAGALMVQMTAFFDNHRRKIVELAARNRLPAIYGERKFVDDGGLMFYGASLATMYQDAAVYTDKILKGAKPSDLPVEQPTKLELVINAKAARAIGAAIPQSLLVRADQVVEK
jgi:putative ABC transport system substrate-binding protein